MARNQSKILHELLSDIFHSMDLNQALPRLLAGAAEGAAAEAEAAFLSAAGSSSAVTYGIADTVFRAKAFATELLVSLGMQDENPVAISDYSHYVFAHTALVERGVKALLAAPLMLGGRIVGLLMLLRIREEKAFGPRDSRFLQLLSMAVPARMETLKLREQDRAVWGEVEAVRRTSSTLGASLELPTVLDSILSSAHELVPADLAHIFLYDGKKLSFGAASGRDGRWDIPFSEPRSDGLTYKVARNGQAIVVEDIQRDPLYKGAPKEWSGVIAGLPLKVKGHVVGVMNISRYEVRPFSEEQLRILGMLADQAAIAVENARLYEAERTQRLRIEAIQTAVEAWSRSLELREVLEGILTELRKVIPYDSASVMLQEGNCMCVVAGRDLPQDSAVGKTYPIMEVERELQRTGRPFILVDAAADERFHGWGNTQYVRGWMGVPLMGRAGMIGCLTIDSRQLGAYSDEEADLAMSFAHQAAIAVENAQLHQNVKEQLAELQSSQDKLVQSEKMAAIGKLVAGVAHELNNPLTAIIGIAQLLQTRELEESIRQDLGKLVAEAHRAGKIVRSLLDYSRQQRPERRAVQINDVLSRTLKTISYELECRKIESDVQLAEDLPTTTADANQLQQVFVNLIKNAYEAMFEANGGGTLTVRSEKIPLKSDSEGGNGQTDRSSTPSIRICIGDDGPGISPEIQGQIFDPFFTTKAPGRGTGLGLSVCHGIINEHGGQIQVESVPGQGCRFLLQLPVVSPEDDLSEAGGDRSAETAQGGGGTILVVEDEEVVRTMVVRILQQAGYLVQSVADGVRALERVQEENFDLIICDVRMPGLSGIDLYKQWIGEGAERPGRFLFITGDTVSADTVGFMGNRGIPYLEKPFEIQALLEAVKRELAG